MVRKRPKWCTWPKKCIQSSYSTKLGHLERRARIQLGRVNFGVFSMTCFVPPALTSDWTWPALSSVICHPSSVLRRLSSAVRRPLSVVRCPSYAVRRPPSVIRHLSLTGGSKWLEVMIFRYWFFVIDGGSQLTFYMFRFDPFPLLDLIILV